MSSPDTPRARRSVDDVNGRRGVVLRRVHRVVGVASLDVDGAGVSTI
jgi:hypothetical protein